MPRAHRGLALCAALGAWLLAMFGLGNAGEAAGPTEAGWKCAVPAEEQWSAAEKFAWDRICAGRQADFSENGVYLDPAKAEGWEQDRTLSAAFLRTILSDRYRQALTPVGVSIVNSPWKRCRTTSVEYFSWPCWSVHLRVCKAPST